MPDLPLLAPTADCPDQDCPATIGQRHGTECSIAICLDSGIQRKLCTVDTAADRTHGCGEQRWTGYPPGSVEAAAHGLWVRPATADDQPHTGWIPCEPGEPDAVPDLDRVMRAGQWNRARQVWELPESSEVR